MHSSTCSNTITYYSHLLISTGATTTTRVPSHVRVMGSSEKATDTTRMQSTEAQDIQSPPPIGGGLPPVTRKMVTKIEAGEFIDMADLLPDRLSCYHGHATEDENKSKKRCVSNILEWIQCFGW